MWHSLTLHVRGTVLAEVDSLSLKSFCIDISMAFITKVLNELIQ